VTSSCHGISNSIPDLQPGYNYNDPDLLSSTCIPLTLVWIPAGHMHTTDIGQDIPAGHLHTAGTGQDIPEGHLPTPDTGQDAK